MAKLKNPTKQTGKLYAHILVDESGSMMADRVETVGAIEEYLSGVDQKNTTVTITYFEGGNVNNVCECVTPKEAKRYIDQYQPNGMTNLFDAIGESIGFIDKRVKTEKNEAIAFVVITDGMENCSKEFKAADVKKLIKSKEKEDWLMIYLGADQDGFAAGQGYGFTGGMSASYSKSNLRGTFSDLATRTTNFAAQNMTIGASAAKAHAVYNDKDRENLVKNENKNTEDSTSNENKTSASV